MEYSEKASAMCAMKITQRGFSIWPNSCVRGQFSVWVEMLKSNRKKVGKWNRQRLQTEAGYKVVLSLRCLQDSISFKSIFCASRFIINFMAHLVKVVRNFQMCLLPSISPTFYTQLFCQYFGAKKI